MKLYLNYYIDSLSVLDSKGEGHVASLFMLLPNRVSAHLKVLSGKVIGSFGLIFETSC